MKKSNFILMICLICAMTGLGACAPTVSNRGNLLKDYQMVTLEPGTSTKSDVLRALGSPTTQDAFDENNWFYIGQVKEKTGIFDPKVTSERIVQVTFNQEGIVQSIKDVGGQGEAIPYQRDKTPTSGNEVTVMQQLLGNLGRFNGAGAGVGSPGR